MRRRFLLQPHHSHRTETQKRRAAVLEKRATEEQLHRQRHRLHRAARPPLPQQAMPHQRRSSLSKRLNQLSRRSVSVPAAILPVQLEKPAQHAEAENNAPVALLTIFQHTPVAWFLTSKSGNRNMTTTSFKSKIFILCFTTFALFSHSFAQVPEDALRLSSTGDNVGARAMGMGNAYIGVADDYTAVFWNPAGLAQMRRLEITGGIMNNGVNNDSYFLGNPLNASTGKNSSTTLNDLGFVFPFPTVRGSLVFAFGYSRVKDFTSVVDFNGFNAKSSIIPSLYDNDVSYDIPFHVYLEDTTGYTPIRDSVNQSGETRESGGLSVWAFSGAIDVEKDLSFGLTINVLTGSYGYVRNYLEADTKNHYQNFPWDFSKFYYNSNVSDDISGINAMFGMMYRLGDKARFGLTLKTPTSITVRESYTNSGQSVFDNGDGYQYSYDVPDNNYGVLSPWVFGVGASVTPVNGLLLAADIQYADWSQVQWQDNATLQQDNSTLTNLFRATTNIHIGGEFQIPGTGVSLRAGYYKDPSKFAGDPSSYDLTAITGGVGILLQNDVLLDGAIAFGSTKTYHNNYVDPFLPVGTDASRTDETIKTTNVNFTISYRF
jgi:long-subunit fatty acid transport protein